MVITSDFNTFANNYHKQNGTTRVDIMSELPNNIIMRIVREADGGIWTHKCKYSKVLGELNNIIDDNSIKEAYDEDAEMGGDWEPGDYLSFNWDLKECWGTQHGNTIEEGIFFGGGGYEVFMDRNSPNWSLDKWVKYALWVDRIDPFGYGTIKDIYTGKFAYN